MRSNYRPIGDFVHQLKKKNKGLLTTDLRGVSIFKEFMPSVANVNGTDLSNYRIVEKGQFAYNPMHVGRDEVLPIAHFKEDDPIIVSPAYVVFEVNSPQEILPEYLMMWCRRTEFDRFAWFTTDSSVRGGFNWDDFCNMELPVPSMEKQREIVKEFQTIVDRIHLNEQLNQKLEEAAQAIYRHWFVDFEFPMSAEYARSIGKPELEGQPYRSSGGEMEYDEAIDQEVPKGWRVSAFDQFFPIKTGKKDANFASPSGIYPFFTCSKTQTLYTNTYSFDCAAILLAGNGDFNVKVYQGKFEAYQRTYVLEPYEPKLVAVLYLALCYELTNIASSQRGSVISYLTKGMIGDHQVIFPSTEELETLSTRLNSIIDNLAKVATELGTLASLNDVILRRLSMIKGQP